MRPIAVPVALRETPDASRLLACLASPQGQALPAGYGCEKQ